MIGISADGLNDAVAANAYDDQSTACRQPENPYGKVGHLKVWSRHIAEGGGRLHVERLMLRLCIERWSLLEPPGVSQKLNQHRFSFLATQSTM